MINSCLVESVSLITKVVKSKFNPTSVLRSAEMNSSHNESLMKKSFLPSAHERNFSKIKPSDENIILNSRNLSRELFKGQHISSQANKSRLSIQSRSVAKSGNRFVKRLKTPDLSYGQKDQSNANIEMTPEPSESKSTRN